MEQSARAAREGFSELVNRAAYGRERVVVTRRGKPVAAVVSLEDLRLLEELEDRFDAEEARAALAEHRASGSKGVPLEEIKKDLGL